MPEWITWGLGILNVVQFVRYILDKRTRSAHDAHLVAAKDSLVALRAMCIEAINSGEVIKNDPTRQFVRQIAYTLVGIEGHLNAALSKPVTALSSPPPPSDLPVQQ